MSMRRLLLLVAIALAAAACQPGALTAKPKPVTAESISLQPGDVSGLQRCSASGDVAAVLQAERSRNRQAYDLDATEWEQWRYQGASDAYLAVYGRTGADCDAVSTSGTGAPTGGLMVGLIVQFKSEAIAARTYGSNSTLLGFGPRDIAFIRLVGGSLMTGSDTGLGPRSVVGSGSVPGSTYDLAFWQNKLFDSFLIAYDLPSADAQVAANDVNHRIR
jgi:hypothetical protein